MSQTSLQRRLAAILVADVVGYSRLMEADEAATLAALRDRRKGVVEPLVRENGGRIVKFMGDGVLVEFASAVNALRCALDLQKQMAEANEKLPERQIVLRIGVNLGEVVGEGSDIFGDGVNIAARLEGLAEPGGICISAKVHDEVRGKLDFAAADLGDVTLKNIIRPVKAFRISAGTNSKLPVEPRGAADSKPSIAVLPFTNMSGDPEQEYFADGITEDIITELARFNSLFVIARNSSFHYKGQSPKIQDVGSALGVNYVVEGSVRKSANRVRITAQLIEAATGNHVWAERYDRDLEEIFAVQDEVVREIVTAVPGALDAAAIHHVQRKPVENLTAYDYLIRAIQMRRQDWGSREAASLLEKVIAADPQSAYAYAHLADWHGYSILAHGVGHQEARSKTLAVAKKAIQLDPNASTILSFVAQAYGVIGELEMARNCLEKAIKHNPNSYIVMSVAGLIFAYLGDLDEALRWNEKFLRYDPVSIESYREASLEINYIAGRYEDAIKCFVGWHNPPRHSLAVAAAAYAQAGYYAEAVKLREEHAARVSSGCSFADLISAQMRWCAHQKQRDLWLEGYRKAGFDC